MKYVPLTFGLEGEIDAIINQTFGSNVAPFIQIIKDIKMAGGKASVLNDLEGAIKKKSDNIFFITIPQNYDLTKKLKKPINAFFTKLRTSPLYETEVYKQFTKYQNVIPVIEVNFDTYTSGELYTKKAKITSLTGSYAYRVNIDKYHIIEKELSSIVNSNDFIIYDLGKEYLYQKGKLRREVNNLNNLRTLKSCQLIVVKQIYDNLTFLNMPNRKIISSDSAYNCIDYDFYKDFKIANFDHFGDWAGIRNIPIYDGGMPYPAYLTVELDTFEHHGFKGIEKDNASFETTLLPNYSGSDHWNKILSPAYKSSCYSSKYLSNFINHSEKANSAQKWKTITISHFYKATDHKISIGYI